MNIYHAINSLEPSCTYFLKPIENKLSCYKYYYKLAYNIEKFVLNTILINVDIINHTIIKDNNNYKLKVKNKNNEEVIYKCIKLIGATGLSKPNIEIFQDVKVPIKHYYEFDKNYFLNEENLKRYINKRILIIGGGNAGYEIANLLTNYGSHIRIFVRRDKV